MSRIDNVDNSSSVSATTKSENVNHNTNVDIESHVSNESVGSRCHSATSVTDQAPDGLGSESDQPPPDYNASVMSPSASSASTSLSTSKRSSQTSGMTTTTEQVSVMANAEHQAKQSGLWANCCCCFQSLFSGGKKQNSNSMQRFETIKLLLLGLDNAGKTTVALHLAGESVDDVVSTIGFSNYELSADNYRSSTDTGALTPPPTETAHPPRPKFRIVLYDLGGGRRIRSIWRNYYSLVHGIIFVIDSSDMERIPEVRQLLHEVVASPKVAGKPILIYLNKQDLHDAIDEIDICKFTNLEELVSQYKCITKIEPIIARNVPSMTNNANNATQVRVDPTLEASFRWLLDFIQDNWDELNSRVGLDSQEQLTNEHNSLRERIDRTKAKQQFIEIETNVPITKQSNGSAGASVADHGSNAPIAEAPIAPRRLLDTNSAAALATHLRLTPSRLSPIEEASSSSVMDDTSSEDYQATRSLNDEEPAEEHSNDSPSRQLIDNNKSRGIMKKSESSESGRSLPPLTVIGRQSAVMEIIITQPGSGGSTKSSNSVDSTRLSNNFALSRSNKIYPS